MTASLFTKLETAASGTALPLSEVLDAISWNADGLIPAIAQDKNSQTILMMAWMNREALLKTLNTGQVHYYSRRRQALWRKGETSGHTQTLAEARLDCDGDTLLLQVTQKGAACHTDRANCFYNRLDESKLTVELVPPR